MNISICIGIRNRFKSFGHNLLSSLNLMESKDKIELCVVDWLSDDIENLQEYIKNYTNNIISIKYIKLLKDDFYVKRQHYNRAYCLHQALKLSTNKKVFLCDIDMTLPIDFVKQFNENVDINKIWFPICFTLNRNKPRIISDTNGRWRTWGYGMVGIMKEDYFNIGGYSFNYLQWGKEDNDFYKKVKGSGLIISRERCEGLFHNFHGYESGWLDRDHNKVIFGERKIKI